MNTRWCSGTVFSVAAWALLLVLLPALGLLPQQAFATDPATAAPTVLRLANGEWPPYTGEKLPGNGCDSQVVSEVFAEAGIEVHYTFLPWARGMLLSKSGAVDGAIEWADTPEHLASHFVSSQPLSAQRWVFFHHRDAAVPWQQLEDLQQQRIGLTIGYAYSDVFKPLQAKYPAMFSEAPSDLLNLKKLLHRRLDLVPLERGVGHYLLRTAFSPQEQAQIVAQEQAISLFYPHLLLSRSVAGNEQRMQHFDQGLARLKASGRYRAMMAACAAEGL